MLIGYIVALTYLQSEIKLLAQYRQWSEYALVVGPFISLIDTIVEEFVRLNIALPPTSKVVCLPKNGLQ